MMMTMLGGLSSDCPRSGNTLKKAIRKTMEGFMSFSSPVQSLTTLPSGPSNRRLRSRQPLLRPRHRYAIPKSCRRQGNNQSIDSTEFLREKHKVRLRRFELPRDYLPLGPQNILSINFRLVFLRENLSLPTF